MSLAKIVEFLDRPEVTEVVLATGKPVTVRSDGEYRPASRAPVSAAQLASLVAGTPVAAMVKDGAGSEPSLRIHDRVVAVEVTRQGDDVIVRLSRPIRARTRTKGNAVPTKRIRRPSTVVPDARAIPVPIAIPLDEAREGSRPNPSEGSRPNSSEGARPTPSEGSRPSARPDPQPAPPPTAAPRGAPDPAFVALVRTARQRGATDLHVAAERRPMARIHGVLGPIGEPLDARAVQHMLAPLLDGAQHEQLATRGYVDSALAIEGAGRLRANLSRVRLGWKGSFRLIADAPPTLEQLGLPKELGRITTYHQGLIVIAGPNGHGKTTTLAALVDLINGARAHHILTIEDPVEIIHPRKRAVVSQREVGTHTRSFAAALKASLREDPDVIVIGELRDRETVEIALTAAETGHLVMATMSTPSAAKTLDRLIDMFPPDDQQQVRTSLAAALRFVVAQRLLPTADGAGLVAAVELLTGVLPLAALIRDNKLFQVGSLQQRGRAFGMIRMDDSLAELVRRGRIHEQVALRASENRKELGRILGKAVH